MQSATEMHDLAALCALAQSRTHGTTYFSLERYLGSKCSLRSTHEVVGHFRFISSLFEYPEQSHLTTFTSCDVGYGTQDSSAPTAAAAGKPYRT